MAQVATVFATLAQSSEQTTPLPVLLFYLGIPAFTLVAVGVACWFFWRAKQRDDARERAAGAVDQQPEHKELTWRNARSS
ncbi:MAG: hypothetical protein ACR2OD_07880 [Gaiellaceae bacterium]